MSAQGSAAWAFRWPVQFPSAAPPSTFGPPTVWCRSRRIELQRRLGDVASRPYESLVDSRDSVTGAGSVERSAHVSETLDRPEYLVGPQEGDGTWPITASMTEARPSRRSVTLGAAREGGAPP